MKVIKITFVILFGIMIFCPFVFANREGSIVSKEENRNLSQKPTLVEEGGINEEFTQEYESWFLDNLGFRNELTNLYAKMQYYVFDNIFDTDMYMGKTGDLIYATGRMITDYQHLNLRTPEEVTGIADSYQVVSDWLEQQGIQFYYVQCYDKHSIYPERFMEYVHQDGQISKTDQVITELTDNTTVNVISFKETLLENKEKYDVFCHYGDPTHWSWRGAYLCYLQMMHAINENNDNRFKILQEEDLCIEIEDQGKSIKGDIYFEDFQESFDIIEPNAVQSDLTELQTFAEDSRHSVWSNPKADNDTRVLIVGDSYGDMLIEFLAESFSKTSIIWADHTVEMEEMVKIYQPDIVLYECAERVDRSELICDLADEILRDE